MMNFNANSSGIYDVKAYNFTANNKTALSSLNAYSFTSNNATIISSIDVSGITISNNFTTIYLLLQRH